MRFKLGQALLILPLLFVLLTAGCTHDSNSTAKVNGDSQVSPKQACISLCQQQMKSGRNLSAGPCLSDDNPNWTISGWVCDVAHSPRQQVDNRRENQCDDWHQGQASHFVEVTPNCKVIQQK